MRLDVILEFFKENVCRVEFSAHWTNLKKGVKYGAQYDIVMFDR